jgi:NADH-quinone oxidoreductase subunit D
MSTTAICEHQQVEILDIPLPPSHPAGHGLMRIRGTVVDGTVVRAEVVTGLMHRGAEKLFESRDYRQILSLANRHDWLSSFDGELSVARVIEDALGIAVPVRAAELRRVISEICRINHHLYWLGETIAALGGDATALREVRAAITDALDLLTGARMHLMIVRIGGLSMDVDDGWRDAFPLAQAIEAVTGCLDDLADRLQGVAVLQPEQARQFATSGVVARASGWERDHRDYLRPVVRQAGDALARMQCLVEEVLVSCDYALTAHIPGGAIDTKLPRTIRLPEGEYYGASETGSGVNGWWIISRGDVVPWRMKMRTASFNNAAALGACLPGTRVADLPVALMSFLLVAGDMDK